MSFRVSGLSVSEFTPLFALSDAELLARGFRRCRAPMAGARMPCRVSLGFTPPGETAILLAYTHQPAPHSPFRASGPIFVREKARETFDRIDELPPALADSAALSLRAYDEGDMMVDADIVPGSAARPALERLLGRVDVAYVHAHFAPRGCYLARIDRA
ncbi:MAG TPA: DUF1203 domain-containing protein [Stellaceae bacterium]|nr:DUF1203 domain-containing protein [Stellaceae bacterium]